MTPAGGGASPAGTSARAEKVVRPDVRPGRRPAAVLPRASVLLLAAGLLLPATAPAVAQQGGGSSGEEELRKRIEESQQRLEQIREERERLRSEMQRLEQRVSTRREALENLERRIGTSASVVAELDVQIRARRAEVETITREMLRTRDRLTVREVELRQRLREIYKRGALGPVRVLLSAESFSDLIDRYKYLHMITLYDRMLVRQVSRLEGRLEEQRGELRGQLDRLRVLRGEKRDELQELEQLEAQHQRQIARLRSRESRHETRLAGLAREEQRLQELMNRLERLRREAERREGRSSTSTLRTSDLGSLAWPVDGEILYRYGPERQGGSTIHRDGVGIGAPAGTPVRAVEAGRVAWAGDRGVYGPSVILSHGGGYYSVYLYLEEIRVRQDTRVERGQVLGTVGGAGSREGPHVQFEIHEPGADGSPRAVDPVKWLREHGG